MKRIPTFSMATLFLFTTFLLLPEISNAIPAFARKYKTSCATCHVGFPKLTPFGETYRLNGFQMPEDEEGSVKEEPVKLGSEGYKRVWPKAIWPGSIPGTAPVSFRVRSTFKYSNETETGRITEFSQPTLQIMTGGSFTEKISFFAGAHLFEHGSAGSIDRLYLRFNHLMSEIMPHNLLNIRVGQFVPDLVTYITNHRSLTHAAYAFNTFAPGNTMFEAGHAHGTPAFGIEAFQLGVEAGGLMAPRIRYIIGVVNGNGTSEENNSEKDYYGKLAFKIGGMAFDGSSKGDIYGGRADNWAEKSLTVSVFSYSGTHLQAHEGDEHSHTAMKTLASFSGDHDSTVVAMEDIMVNRVGIDLNLFLRDLNIFGGIISGSDAKESYSLVFSEANYMIYPWLIGVIRYERAIPDGSDSIQRVVVHCTALYTANVKFNIESRFDPDKVEFTNLIIGLDFAF